MGRFASINVKDYGATGGGEADDTAAIQAAIDAAEANGAEIFVPAGEYVIDGVDIGAACSIRGPGTFLMAADITYGFKVQLTWGASTSCTIADEDIGTGSNLAQCTKVTATGHNLTRGQVLKFVANETNPVGGGVGEMARVQGVVDANNFRLDRQLEDIQPGDTTISYRTIPDDKIDLDVNFKLTGAEGATGGGDAALVWIDGAVDPRIRIRTGRVYTVISLLRSVWGGTVDVVSQDAWDSQDPAINAYGYGVVAGGGTCGTKVTVNTQGGRHAFTTAGVSGFSYSTTQATMAALGHSRDVVVSGVSHGCYSASFDTHDGGKRIRFENCRAIAPSVSEYDFSTTGVLPIGFQDRSIDTEFYNCTCIGGRHAFNLLSGSTQPATQPTSVKMVGCSDQDVTYISIRVGNSNSNDSKLHVCGYIHESDSQLLDLDETTCYLDNVTGQMRDGRSMFYLDDSTLFASNVRIINAASGGPAPIYSDSGTTSTCKIDGWIFNFPNAATYPRYIAKANTGTTLELYVGGYSTHGRDLTSVVDSSGAGTVNAYLCQQPANYDTASSGDTTPTVINIGTLFTNNSGATTIADFDNGIKGQKLTVIIGDANTTINFTTGSLKGNGGANWSPASGDHMDCTFDGTDWVCNISDNT